jgi:hypothetical protein
MKLRDKSTKEECSSGNFNTSSLSEIIVYYKDGGSDTDYIDGYEVYLEIKKEWKDLKQAFKDKDVIPDNFNTRFAEPNTPEDKIRGYNP